MSSMSFMSSFSIKRLEDMDITKKVEAKLKGNENDKILFPIRVLQVLPTAERFAVHAKEIIERLVSNFGYLNDDKFSTRVNYQLKILAEAEVLLESSTEKRHWYRNPQIDIDLNNPDLDTLSTLAILAKVAERLLVHSKDSINQHVSQLTHRFEMVSPFDKVNRLAERFAYADFTLESQANPAVIRTLQKALLDDLVVTVLHKPRDTEKLRVDVGLTLGIVQKSNLQTLILLARSKKHAAQGDAEILRLSVERIEAVHFRRCDGELEKFSVSTDEVTRAPTELWHRPENDPTVKFQQYLKQTAGGLLMRPAPAEKQILDVENLEPIASERQIDETDEHHQVELVAHVHQHLMTHLSNAKLSPDQKFTRLESAPDYVETGSDDAWFELRATVVPSENLEWWIMSWAERIVVLGPPKLRHRLSGRIGRAAKNYEVINRIPK